MESRGVSDSNFPGLKSHRISTMSWKVMENQPNVCHIFDLCTCFQPLYTLLLSTGINGAEKSWKMHIKVLESHEKPLSVFCGDC